MSKRFTILVTGAVVAALVAMPIGEAGAKKRKPKPKPAKACAAFVPGERGTGKPTVIVTDAATAEAPVEQTITLGPDFDEGLQGEPVADHFNVQVDSAAASAGLYVTFEFQSHRDYDLWGYHPDGSLSASSHGFQPLIDTQGTAADESNTATNHAGESKADSENIVGLITPDCGGWTFGFENYFGEGGEFKVKVWLGEGTTAPKPAGEEQHP